jgi:hypothetical protein
MLSTLLLALSMTTAMAEVSLSFRMSTNSSIFIVEVEEQGEGTSIGKITTSGGAGYVKVENLKDKILIYQSETPSEISRVVKKTKTLYSGVLHSSVFNLSSGYSEKKKRYTFRGTWGKARINGTIDTKKKKLNLRWSEPYRDRNGEITKVNMDLNLKADKKEGPGECKGDLRFHNNLNSGKVASIFCSTKDENLDILFKDPEKLIAWVMIYLVNPKDAS